MTADSNTIRAALTHIPAHDRDTWLRMAMAVKSELGEAGFDLWDQWSQSGESYRERDARAAWRSIKANGKVTIGTLFHEAQRNGFKLNGHRPESRQRRPAEAREAKRHATAKERAATIWEKAKPASDDHPYLKRKRVPAHGLRLDKGRLVIPLRDVNGELSTLEFISPDGAKKYLPGGSKTGCYFAIGKVDGSLCIAEGFATAASIHEATGLAVAAAMDAGNLKPVALALRSKFKDVKLILCADDDSKTPGNLGVTKAREAALAVNGLLAVPEDGVKDFNDLSQMRGREAVERSIAEATDPDSLRAEEAWASSEPQPKARPSFTAVPLSVALKNMPASKPLVEKVFERSSLVGLFGDENTRKSFLALDLALSVASGIPYHGLRVTQCKTLFIAGEGHSGLLRRAKAWLARHKVESPPEFFFVNITPADLLNLTGAEEVRSFVLQTLGVGEDFGLIVIDTMSRAMPGGNENASEDMSRLIGNLDELREATGAAVLLVHHTPLEVRDGKGKVRPRGHSSLIAALDTAISCEFDLESEIATLSVTKQKDGEPIEPMRFAFVRMDLGEIDGFGNPRTTLVPELTNDKPKKSKAGLGRAQKQILRVLENEGELEKSELLTKARNEGIRTSSCYAALDALLDRGFILQNGQVLRLS